MVRIFPYATLLLASIAVNGAAAQAVAVKEAAAAEPFLLLEAGGPVGEVTSLAFSPDGDTLYAAGSDKAVRVWKRDPATGAFAIQRLSYRVPLGPGPYGAIRAIAVSPDGKRLAVGGMVAFPGISGFRDNGISMPPETFASVQREAVGAIYVYDVADPSSVRELRGHRDKVVALAFVGDNGSRLASMAEELIDGSAQRQGAVRLWDVDAGTSLASRAGLPSPVGRFPSVLAWSVGPEPRDVKVAIACDERAAQTSQLRVWSVANDTIETAPIGSYNGTLAALGDGKTYVSGSFGANGGNLHAWPMTGGLAKTGDEAVLIGEGGLPVLPRTIAPLANANGQTTHVALVVQTPQPRNEYRMQVVPWGGAQRHGPDTSWPLWPIDKTQPVLASSLRGGCVALAGAPDHSIRVYQTQDLIRDGAAAKPQVLRSVAAQFGAAAFAVDAKGQLGVALSDARKPRPGAAPPRADFVFDVVGRKLSPGDAGWRTDAPELGGWQIGLPEGPPTAARVTSPQGAVKLLAAPGLGVVADFALSPQGPGPTLVAIAANAGSLPRLAIYDLATGHRVADLQGHVGPVRSVAFSSDGRLLVTASDDHTVCVWGLHRLREFIGTQGQFHGLGVEAAEGKLRVSSTDGTQTGLRVGEVIDAVVLPDGAMKAFATPAEFYGHVLTRKPGSQVELRVAGRGPVFVQAQQATQVRTPLAMLFVTREGAGSEREWMAWNPLGAYDSSSPRIARSFGWHHNPARPGAAAQFVSLEQDDPRERRQGILKHLVRRASLGPALEDYEAERTAKPLAPPKMTMGVDDGPSEGVVRAASGGAWIRLEGIGADRVDSVMWAIDGGAFAPGRGAGLAHTRDFAWKRGEHRIDAVVRTAEETPQEFRASLTFRYVPPPPAIAPRGAAADIAANRPVDIPADGRLHLLAAVSATDPSEKVRVQVFHQQRPFDADPNVADFVDRKIPLVPGSNRVEIVATNAGATMNDPRETRRFAIDVRYVPDKMPEAPLPPLVALDAIVPLVGGKTPGAPLAINGQTPVIVESSKVRVRGSIRANVNLSAVRSSGAGVAGFIANRSPDYALDETVSLTPGRNEIAIVGRAGEGTSAKETERRVVVEYRPGLPTVVFASPENGAGVADLGDGIPDLRVAGTLAAGDESAPAGASLKLSLLVNDREFPATLAANGVDWSAVVKVEPGPNRIRAKVANLWRDAVQGDLQVVGRRPPRIVRGEVESMDSETTLRLRAEVSSTIVLKREGVRATVRDASGSRRVTSVKLVAPADKTKPWGIELRTPLSEGDNDLELVVSNADGASQAKSWSIKHTPAKATPRVVLVTPLSPNLVVSDPVLNVQFEVHSASALKSATLLVNGQPVPDYEIDLTRAVETSDQRIRLAVGKILELTQGINTVSLEAVNEGGLGKGGLTANYKLPPQRLELDTLRTPEGQERRVRATAGNFACDPLPNGRVELFGKIAFAKNPDRDDQPFSVYVNGALQYRGSLQPPERGVSSRRFSAELVLDRAENNEIELDFPRLQIPAEATRKLVAACQQPQLDKRLHVLAISPNEPNEVGLVEQLVAALSGDGYNASTGEFSHRGFTQATMHRPLAGKVDALQILGRLRWLGDQIEKRKRDGFPNDVLLVYFAGAEAGSASQELKLSRGTISTEELAKALADTYGVKLLLLDVTSAKGAARNDTTWNDPQVRHAWMRAAWRRATAPPEDARLLPALQKSLPTAGQLHELVPSLVKHRQFLTRQYESDVQLDWWIPASLERLALRR